MATTSPDAIYKADSSAPVSIIQESQTQGDSIQTALNKRQRYDYVWTDQADRNAQTGMVQGSRGYQVDVKGEYIYDNSAWRLALSHAEFTASVSAANATLVLAGTWTLDASQSTNAVFVTPGGNGILTITDPGIYAVSTVSTNAATVPMTGRGFLDLSFVSSAADIQRVSVPVGEDRGSLSSPNVRVTAANTDLYFQLYQTTGGTRTVSTRARVTRIG